MTDRPNERPRRRPRQAQRRPEGERAHGDLPPHEYEQHLERDHNLRVVAEPGWPTEVKRFRLVKPEKSGKPEGSLEDFVGTKPQAIAHFYHHLHPAGHEQQLKTPLGKSPLAESRAA